MTLTEFKLTGGATYGLVSATWPFATLSVSRNKLELNISLVGNLQFKPADIISITPTKGSFSGGIQINHKVNNYYSTVVFKPRENISATLQQIQQTGFLNNITPLPTDEDKAITTMQATGGFAVKLPAAIAIIVIWNVLLLQAFLRSSTFDESTLTNGIQPAVIFMLLLGIALTVSGPFRSIVLKKGRTFNHIRSTVYFLMLICCLMLIVTFATANLSLPHHRL